MATHTTKDKSTDVYGDKREEDTAAQPREGPPGLAMVAQPHLPRIRALQGWVVIDVERLDGEVISLCGAGGVCEAIDENWLAACRIKDQLQPKSPPRRIYNPLCCGLGSFGFNLNHHNCCVVEKRV